MSHSKEYVTITRSPCVLLINIDNLGILTGCQECIMYILVLSQSSDVSSHTQINCGAAGREHEHTLSIYKELIWACLHNTTFIYYIYYILAINLLFHLFANCILKKKKKAYTAFARAVYNSYKTKDTFSHLQIHKNISKCNSCKQDLTNNFFFCLFV